ncbi:FAD/NAD(P)-binding oxidoreductase [Pelagicoccus enzymogenes]|uniref:type III sulfide quinone reductase, selenoprotein subtype n=1 Tax=Pelagicoccus enzymogenes TaxID=2773457 RepID=UPI00280CE519|nr:FAD/NAD(P)-binding oxidoreductase [Pelagicoccus enzymogenes]MDQ8196665.1 FAD/NAD(P)-binding oxidoreductase [Pelagicoccus enzymogenes]
MKKLLILGAGTAGTIVANKMIRKLPARDWCIQIVDQDPLHYYQPGFLFMPFGVYGEKDVVKPKSRFLSKRVDLVMGAIDRIEPDSKRVLLEDGTKLDYDLLVVATGTTPRPEETEGMEGDDWGRNVHEFYTFEGAGKLARRLKDWQGGRLVINVAEMPIKCPVAPLEFAFLADWWLTKNGLRDKTEIQYVTPLSGAFTKPVATERLQHMLSDRRIHVETDFAIGSVDNSKKQIVSWDERTVDYDLLVTVPTNMGSDAIERSGLGDELNFVPTNKETLQADGYENIFVIGDATDVPASKAGSVAHFEAEILEENLLSAAAGKELEAKFDGHSNCFVETGYGKGMLIDFNYETEPLPGTFPFAKLGPMPLLEESRVNHWGKLMFRHVYWNALLKGWPLGIGPAMSLKGKRTDLIRQPAVVQVG